jgi:hypothetical protein
LNFKLACRCVSMISTLWFVTCIFCKEYTKHVSYSRTKYITICESLTECSTDIFILLVDNSTLQPRQSSLYHKPDKGARNFFLIISQQLERTMWLISSHNGVLCTIMYGNALDTNICTNSDEIFGKRQFYTGKIMLQISEKFFGIRVFFQK